MYFNRGCGVERIFQTSTSTPTPSYLKNRLWFWLWLHQKTCDSTDSDSDSTALVNTCQFDPNSCLVEDLKLITLTHHKIICKQFDVNYSLSFLNNLHIILLKLESELQKIFRLRLHHILKSDSDSGSALKHATPPTPDSDSDSTPLILATKQNTEIYFTVSY